MTSTLAAALLVATLSADAPVPPGGTSSQTDAKDAQIRAQVNEYLGSDDVAAAAERWRALGPRAIPFLAKVATDPDSSPPRRVKAIHGLAAVGSETEAQMLLDLARSEPEPPAVRIAALRDGLRLLPAKKRVAVVRPMLKGAHSVRVRVAAAETLTRLSRRECAAVQAQVGKEKPRDQRHYQRALRRCPRPSSQPAVRAAVPAEEPAAQEPAAR